MILTKFQAQSFYDAMILVNSFGGCIKSTIGDTDKDFIKILQEDESIRIINGSKYTIDDREVFKNKEEFVDFYGLTT